MKRLQVKINGNWEYVFCSNKQQSIDPIITKVKTKALKAHALEYFQGKYGNHIFRVS